MRSRRRMVVLTVFAAVAAVIAVAGGASAQQVQGNPDIDVVAPNNHVTPGEQAVLKVSLTNEGEIERGGPAEYVQRVTTARGASMRVREGDAPVSVDTGRIPVGSVPEGTVGPFDLQISVEDGAPAGRYQLPVDLRYRYTRSVDLNRGGQAEFYDLTAERRATLTVVVKDRASFRVRDARSDVLVGGRGNVTLTLENSGSETARDVSVTATAQSDELRFGSSSASATGYVAAWEPGQERSIEYDVALSDEANLRGYSIDVDVSFRDDDGVRRRSRQLTTGFSVGREQSFAMEDVTSDLAVGDDGSIEGRVVNAGPAPVWDPVLVLTAEDPNLAIDDPEYALPDLRPGNGTRFSFDVDVSESAAEGFKQMPFVVRYENEQGDQLRSEQINERVRIGPDRDDFSVDVSNGTVAAGSGRTITVAVANNRGEPVTNVRAEIFPDEPLGSGDDEGFVARLGPNETERMTFAVSASGGASAKTYPLSLEFQYDDADGDTRVSDTYDLPITVSSSGDGGGFPVGIVLVVLVGLGAVVYWTRFR